MWNNPPDLVLKDAQNSVLLFVAFQISEKMTKYSKNEIGQVAITAHTKYNLYLKQEKN